MTLVATARQNLIDGQPAAAATGETLDVLNPATGEVIAQAPDSSAEDVDRAVDAAERAYAGDWGQTTPAERAKVLLALADALEANAEELGSLESLNVGKPRDAAIAEVSSSADVFRFMAGACRLPEGQAAGEYVRGATSIIRREPIGVVGQITPWNYPLMMAAWKVAPALAAGNTIVLKPSELTPLTTLRLGELAMGLLPAGVLNVISGRGEPVGGGLAAHPRIRMISITGSVGSGKKVAVAAAGNLKRVHLELGGKAPVLVFDDADIDAVTATLKSASFWNAGQDCTAACRIVAGPKIYDDLVAGLVSTARSLRVGDPARAGDVDMGPVVSREHQQRVLGFVDRAAEAGAKVVTGGSAVGSRGFFVEPTVVTDTEQSAEIVQQEVFGPVVTVQRFADDDEAIAWANDVEYGLSASVWTGSAKRGLRAIRDLEYGCVWLNDHFTLANEMPHGGFKQSGYGKDLSKYGLEDYTVVKHALARFS